METTMVGALFHTEEVKKQAGQGQGSGTEFKERGIQAALSVSLQIAYAKFPTYPYWHIDLNSGSGFNSASGCIGSPKAFLNAAKAIGHQNCYSFFIDINPEAISELESTVLYNEAQSYSFLGNNSELLPVIDKLISRSERNPEHAVGSILCDPNGYFGKETPHEALIDFSKKYPKIDIIFNLNTRQYRLIKGNIDKERKGWTNGRFHPSIRDIPSVFNKKHWLIRGEIGSKDKFVLMVGRNMKAGDHKSLGFEHLESPRGQMFADKAEGARYDDGQSSLI